jgi:hypothetical protein
VPTDSRGATIPVMWWLAERGWQFSVGLGADDHVRQAVLAIPDPAWSPAIDPDGRRRDGAWVAEVTGWLDVGGYPPDTRAICRRERPHPGAPVRFTDPQGRRYQVFVPTSTAAAWPGWSWSTVSTPASRTASARPRPPGWPTCRLTPGVATPSGSSWPWPPRT